MLNDRSLPINYKLELKHLKNEKNNLTFNEHTNDSSIQKSFDKDFDSKKLNHSFKRKLTDQLWYHGFIKRIEAQRLLRHDGDFLVRESISGGPDHYVLSGLWKKKHIHFEINESISDESDYSVTLFHVANIYIF